MDVHLDVIPGDYNHNGSVEAADYVVWRNTLGQVGAGLAADGDGNQQIDAGDYVVWKLHFGQSIIGDSGTLANYPIPEPATWLLLLVAIATFSCRQHAAIALKQRLIGRTPNYRESELYRWADGNINDNLQTGTS